MRLRGKKRLRIDVDHPRGFGQIPKIRIRVQIDLIGRLLRRRLKEGDFGFHGLGPRRARRESPLAPVELPAPWLVPRVQRSRRCGKLCGLNCSGGGRRRLRRRGSNRRRRFDGRKRRLNFWSLNRNRFRLKFQRQRLGFDFLWANSTGANSCGASAGSKSSGSGSGSILIGAAGGRAGGGV